MDDIQLPLVPDLGDDVHRLLSDAATTRIYTKMNQHAQAAVLADRERRKKPERVVHRRDVSLLHHGSVSGEPIRTITLCWTDDGRAWIESEENERLARELRADAETCERNGWPATVATLVAAADALDGGQHV